MGSKPISSIPTHVTDRVQSRSDTIYLKGAEETEEWMLPSDYTPFPDNGNHEFTTGRVSQNEIYLQYPKSIHPGTSLVGNDNKVGGRAIVTDMEPDFFSSICP
jgi:hypothetical protein